MKDLLLLLMLGFGMAAYGQRNVVADARTMDLLDSFRTFYGKVLVQGKPGSLTAYYSDSVRLMPELQRTLFGRRVALHYHAAFAKRWDIRKYDRTLLEVMDLGKRVIEFGAFGETLVLRASGAVTELKGKYADIWERAEDGKLRLVTESWNYSHPVSIRDQLVFDELPGVVTAFMAHVPVNSPISFELAAFNGYQERVITERNAQMWKQFYADDYMMFYSGHPVYRGRKAIDSFLDDHVKHLVVFEKLDIRTDRIDDLGEYVLEYASHTAVVRDGEWSGVATGKDIRLWRRDGNGFLRICRGVAMYDL